MLFIAWISLILYSLGIIFSVKKQTTTETIACLPGWFMIEACLIYLILLL